MTRLWLFFHTVGFDGWYSPTEVSGAIPINKTTANFGPLEPNISQNTITPLRVEQLILWMGRGGQVFRNSLGTANVPRARPRSQVPQEPHLPAGAAPSPQETAPVTAPRPDPSSRPSAPSNWRGKSNHNTLNEEVKRNSHLTAAVKA